MSTSIATRLPHDRVDRLHALAAANGVTVAEWLRMAAALAEATLEAQQANAEESGEARHVRSACARRALDAARMALSSTAPASV